MRAWLKNRRNQLLLVMGVLVAGALAFFLLTRGSNAPAPVALPSSPGATVQSPTPSPSAHHARKLVVFTGRDPFQALSSFQSFVQASPTPSSSSSPSGGTGGLSIATRATSSAVVGGQKVQLVRVFWASGVKKAQVKVGATLYTVRVGAAFHRTFKLSSISGSCANMLYGDQAFTLCK